MTELDKVPLVEVDETYIDGLEKGLRGRHIENKTLAVIAARQNGTKIERVRMKQIPDDASSASLHAFITASIEPGSTIATNGCTGFSGLEDQGYRRMTINRSKQRKPPSDLLPRAHRALALLKQWLMGTHQGTISHDHLDYCCRQVCGYDLEQ